MILKYEVAIHLYIKSREFSVSDGTDRLRLVGVTKGGLGCGINIPDLYTFVAHEKVTSTLSPL